MNYDPNNLWPTDIFNNSKSPHLGFSESVKIFWFQMKQKNQQNCPLNSVKQNVIEGENWCQWGRKRDILIFHSGLNNLFPSFYPRAVLVTSFITYHSCGVLLHQWYKFYSNHPFYCCFKSRFTFFSLNNKQVLKKKKSFSKDYSKMFSLILKQSG